MYQDYKVLKAGSDARTIHGRSVKRLRIQSFRVPALDGAAETLGRRRKGQRCVAGQQTPEPAAIHCKAFRAYNPSISQLGAGQGLLVVVRVSNWSLCDWDGQGRPYADWPGSRWPAAVFEEYHSHLACLVLAGTGLATHAPAAPAQLFELSKDLWARTRAPFYEIFRQGFEDPRLLSVRGELHALVTYGERSARPESTRLADKRVESVGAFRQALVRFRVPSSPGGMGLIGLEEFVPLNTDFDRHLQQKNWMPFNYRDTIYVVYQLVPQMTVLIVDEALGSATVAHETAADPALGALHHAEVRGGSQCLHIAERGIYLGVAHVSRGRGMYTHFFFALAERPPFAMLGVSREWCLAHEETFQSGKELLCEGVQFVSGLALSYPRHRASAVSSTEENMTKGASLLLAYGVMDCDARIAHMPLEAALASIKFRSGMPKDSGTSPDEL